MKSIKLNKKVIGAVACAAALFIGMTPVTAFAQTGKEAECTCDVKCSEGSVNENCPVCKQDHSLCQGEEKKAEKSEENKEEKKEEKMGPLTPDGNMTLVDDYGSMEAGGKQFITVVTKKGNYFYIIIDRDDNGSQTVHFLNMVDEADLLALMDEKEQKAIKESLEDKEKEEKQKATVSEPKLETETKPEVKPEKKKPSIGPAAIVALIIFLGAGGYMGFKYLKEKNPKKESKRPDPDEDYLEDEDDFLEDMDEVVEEEEEEEEETSIDESSNLDSDDNSEEDESDN